MSRPKASDIISELAFSTSRSGGPGGQHVNKVNTKVTLRWAVRKSSFLTDQQKEAITNKLAKKINQVGELVINTQQYKSQIQNKEAAIEKLDQLLKLAFSKKKKRTATKPTKASVQKRLDNKKKHSTKKRMRKKDL